MIALRNKMLCRVHAFELHVVWAECMSCGLRGLRARPRYFAVIGCGMVVDDLPDNPTSEEVLFKPRTHARYAVKD